MYNFTPRSFLVINVCSQGKTLRSPCTNNKRCAVHVLTFQGLAVSLRTTRFTHSKILHGVRFMLSVLYGYQNRERPLLYTSLTDRFYNRGGKCLQHGTD